MTNRDLNGEGKMAGRSGVICLLVVLGFPVISAGRALAQSSVEKEETRQQVKEMAAEQERARVAVGKDKMSKPAPPEAGTEWGIYSTRSSMELGYRFESTRGSRERFLSDVNVRDGLRLLDYSLDMRARPGTGLLFDFLKVDANNNGGDLAQNISMRMEKNRAYNFDSQVRRFNYYRTPGQEFALGYRTHDLRQQISSYRLKLLPQRMVQFNLGYGRSMAKGRYTPTYSYESDMFQLLGSSRWEANDYNLGMDLRYKGWDFGVESFYRNFRNDPTIVSRPGLDTGFGQPAPRPGAISFLDRDVPQRSRSIVTRANARGSISDRLHVVIRGWHDDERMRAPYLETSQGVASNSSTILNRVLTGNGTIERPGNMLDAGLSLDINSNLTLTNTFNYTSWKIEGDVNTLQTSQLRATNGTQSTVIATTSGSRLTDLTSYQNILDLNANYGKRFSAHAGWRRQRRDVTLDGTFFSRTSTSTAVTSVIGSEGESVTTDSFVGGVRMRPVDRTSLFLSVERGQNNNSFVRINPLDFTRVRARSQIRATETLSLIGSFTSLNRVNPTPQVKNDSTARSVTFSANYEPTSRFYLDAGYDYHHLFSTANLAYFVAGSQLRTGKSLYYSRMNSIYFNSRFGVTDRLDLMVYYYYIMDRGAPAVSLGLNDLVNAYPLRRHNPEARLAYRFNNRLTGNLGYRHYSYNEDVFSFQDYRSNILTSSLRITF